MANTTTASPPLSHLIVLGAGPWQMMLLSGIATTCLLMYLLVMIATYRVSLSLHTFLLFLSEGFANCYVLATLVLCYSGQLFHLRLLGDYPTEVFLNTLITYPNLMHYLLIAVNRGCAVFFPLQYDTWWTHSRTVISLALIWVVGGALELVNIVQFIRTHSIPLFLPVYAVVQSCVTYSSLAIYGAALGWVLLGRFHQWWHINKHQRHSAAGVALHSSVGPFGGEIAKAMDLRIFAYCFLSFLPNCYYMVIRPAPNSMHMQLYIVFRSSSNGVLLFAMSSLIREHMPLGLGEIRCCRQLCPKKTVTPVVIRARPAENWLAHSSLRRASQQGPSQPRIHQTSIAVPVTEGVQYRRVSGISARMTR